MRNIGWWLALLGAVAVMSACGDDETDGGGGTGGTPARTEICDNGTDDDGNGFSDCDDASCATDAACNGTGGGNGGNGGTGGFGGFGGFGGGQGGFGGVGGGNAGSGGTPAAETDCGNALDDDGDGLTDCADTDCAAELPCLPGAEICDNTDDDDGDGFADCADDDCDAFPACQPVVEDCGNQLDDDGDGRVDCLDTECEALPICQPAVEDCQVPGDEDSDGLSDCADLDCVGQPPCIELCGNGLDDDLDGFADCLDADCAATPGCQPGAELCGNGQDDDGDGFVDCNDFDCAADPSCGPPALELCGTPGDEDLDGLFDCADAIDCAFEPACDFQAGALVITEIMFNPAGVGGPGTSNPETGAEWFELHNPGLAAIDLRGFQLDDGEAQFTILDSILVPAGGFVVLASPEPASATAPVDLGFVAEGRYAEGIVLSNSGDQLFVIGPNNVTIDVVDYNQVAFDPITAGFDGRSIVLNSIRVDPLLNDDGANWCKASNDPGAPSYTRLDGAGTPTIHWADHHAFGACVADEICDDLQGIDENANGLVNCADPDCFGRAACAEQCATAGDEDFDGLADCADPDCAAQLCGAAGQLCNLATTSCECPGGANELACGDGLDDDCDGAADCADTECFGTPACTGVTINAIDYPVLAHGARLVVSGSGFGGASSVTIGGVAQSFTVDGAGQITVGALDDGTPVGAASLEITVPGFPPASFAGITVIRLQINELDADTPGTDVAEFVEIASNPPGVSLAGYTLVFWNGSNDLSYTALELAATTDANGLLVVGNTLLTPAIVFVDNGLQNGQDAVSIVQGLPADYPAGTLVTAATRVIDAVVYDTADADDVALLDALLWPVGDARRVQIDENTNVVPPAVTNIGTDSIQRCGDGRRDGTRFVVPDAAALAPATPILPSPGLLNDVPACP